MEIAPEQAAGTIGRYNAMLKRAFAVVADAPYWTFIGNPEFARLDIDGQHAILRWPVDEMCYDSSSIETRSVAFPVQMLSWSDAEVTAWKEEQQTIYKMEVERKRRQAVEAQERKERDTYLALKAKYG